MQIVFCNDCKFKILILFLVEELSENLCKDRKLEGVDNFLIALLFLNLSKEWKGRLKSAKIHSQLNKSST